MGERNQAVADDRPDSWKTQKDLCVCVGVEYQFHESLVDMIRQANPEGCVIY